MKLYDVSQLPVIDGEKVAGIVDESDILLRVYEHEERFREPVRTAMTDWIETVEATGDLAALMPIFARDHVALLMDRGRLLVIITRIALLYHLLRRMYFRELFPIFDILSTPTHPRILPPH